MIDLAEAVPDRLLLDTLVRLATTEDPRQPGLFDLHLAVEVVRQSAVVAKSYHWYSIPYGYGPHFRALLAVGGLVSHESGILVAKSMFVSLFLNPDLDLITYDVHGDTY